MQSTKAVAITDRELVITGWMDAPREQVFEAWSSPDHLERWWGPEGFATTTHAFDFNPGGIWRLTMHGPDGAEYPNEIVYAEIEPPDYITYSQSTGLPDHPSFDVRTTFEESDGGTLVSLRMRLESAEARDAKLAGGVLEGGKQTMARLAEYLARDAPH